MTESEWVQHAFWWHIYPLGFVGAFPAEMPPVAEEHRLRRVTEWLDHVVTLGLSGIALGPVFASRTHGYDTTDHYRIDPRLGDDTDFDDLVAQARSVGCGCSSTACSTTSEPISRSTAPHSTAMLRPSSGLSGSRADSGRLKVTMT